MVYWNLYGKKYDLTDFLDKHPGGRRILELSKGNKDLTPLFESYHALSDIKTIKNMMNKYLITGVGTNQLYTFNENDFYYTLKKKIKTYFGKEANVINKIKINYFWIFKIIILGIIFLFTYLKAFIFYGGIIINCVFACLSGIVLIMLGFCVMHDASHYALFSKKPRLNELISNIWNSIAIWHCDLWFIQHTLNHHAYTGDPKRDPDLLFTQPIVRKSRLISSKKYLNISNRFLVFITFSFLFIFPGFFLGSCMVYWLIWKRRGYLWKLGLPNNTKKDYLAYFENLVSYLISIIFIYAHLYRFNLFVSFSYFISANIAYGCCILPDHDTFQTTINHIEGIKDWGEIQVRNSGNFENRRFGDLFCHLFGGINYQIEHHLFPSMCHVHYPEIAHIVKGTCKEFDIPYVHHKTLFGALRDFVKSILIINKEKV